MGCFNVSAMAKSRNKVKLGIFVNSAWQAFNFRLELARSLKDYEIIFFGPIDQNFDQLISKEFEYIHVPLIADSINPVRDIFLIYSVFRELKKNKIQILLNFTLKPNIYGPLIASLLKIKSINNITGLGTFFIKKSFITLILYQLYKLSVSRCDHIFFQNKYDTELFKLKKILTHNNYSLLPGSGIDIHHFYPQEKTTSENFVFLMVARLIKDKGVLEYLQAAELIKNRLNKNNIVFQLVGEMSPKNKTSISIDIINSYINRGIVNYHGMSNDVREQLKNSDCVVLPSYREGCPRSLLEAASMAIPIITTNVPGCNDIVTHGENGLICNVKDSHDLSLKMLDLYQMGSKKRRKLGDNGRKKMIANFSNKIVFREYKKILMSMYDS